MIHTCNWFGASGASFGEELAEAFGTIRFVIARRESLSRQGVVAVAASEAVSVPRLVLICHAAAGDNLATRRNVYRSFFTGHIIVSYPSI